MTTELLDIQPRELKFTFELKKQSSCSIILTNKTEQYVAFKVKTTSPKKYCVRPSSAVIKPKSSCDFTVTMQAQREAPPEMQCKDKFLVQTTAVPSGTTEEEITSELFAKESGKYVEERKIRVSLVSPVQSPVLLPTNGVGKKNSCPETLVPKDRVPSGVENIPPPNKVSQEMEGSDAGKVSTGHLKETNEAEPRRLHNGDEQKSHHQDCQNPNLPEDLEELNVKLQGMDSKLKEAELTIQKLTEERRATNQEKDKLKHDLEMLRKSGGRKVQVGFPLLYVCVIGLISMVVGYIAHA